MKTIIKVIVRSFIITSLIFIICHILNINHIFVSSGPFESYGLFGGRWYMSTGGVAGPGSCVIFTKYDTLHYNIIEVIIKFIIIMLLSCFIQYLYIRKHSIRKMIFIHSVLVLTIIYLLYLYFPTNNLITYIFNYRFFLFIIISILIYDIHKLYVKYKQKHQMKVQQKEQKQYSTISLLNDELNIKKYIIALICIICLCVIIWIIYATNHSQDKSQSFKEYTERDFPISE